jgi:hypothetical protein
VAFGVAPPPPPHPFELTELKPICNMFLLETVQKTPMFSRFAQKEAKATFSIYGIKSRPKFAFLA